MGFKLIDKKLSTNIKGFYRLFDLFAEKKQMESIFKASYITNHVIKSFRVKVAMFSIFNAVYVK